MCPRTDSLATPTPTPICWNLVTVSVAIGVSYDSDLEKVEAICIRVGKKVLTQFDSAVKIAPVVRYNTFADSSINFNVIMHVSDFSNQYVVKHEYIKAIIKEFRKENIEIPFPIRTVITQEHSEQNNEMII